MKSTLLILAILAASFNALDAQKSKQKEEEYKKMIALIEEGSYVFTVQSIQPSGSRTVHTTTEYTLEVNDSTFKAYLPYFGRTYQPSYGGNGGIEFDAAPENLEISLKEKKRMVYVQCDVKGKEDKYGLYLSVGSSGHATLNITSQKRQSISYSGYVAAPEKEKEKEKK